MEPLPRGSQGALLEHFGAIWEGFWEAFAINLVRYVLLMVQFLYVLGSVSICHYPQVFLNIGYSTILWDLFGYFSITRGSERSEAERGRSYLLGLFCLGDVWTLSHMFLSFSKNKRASRSHAKTGL